MSNTERSVFICYRRRVSWATARLVFTDLVNSGFDAFMDTASIDSGQFDEVILAQIASRTHFVLVLEPGSLRGIEDSGDWLRREIGHALACKRNIVPVTAGGFELDASITLPPDISAIARFNAVSIPMDYVEEALRRLRERFLRVPPTRRTTSDDEWSASYGRLERLLRAGQWKAADGATEEAMRAAIGRRYEESLSDEELRRFPCDSLVLLDNLWVEHSEGRFGFSLQRDIWASMGALGVEPKGDDELEREFGGRVGWRVDGKWLAYPDYNFTLTAPTGHLPRYFCRHEFGWWVGRSSLISTRIDECSTAKTTDGIG